MAMSLHEYCLHHINAFLKPHDWVQLSRVCQFWKLATSKNWKSITEIEYQGSSSKSQESIIEGAITVSAVELGKILLCAAPFVKVLRVTGTDCSYYFHHIMIGNHHYKVMDFGINNVLKLLAKKSTELTEISFDWSSPKAELIRPLLETNNIKKYKIYDGNFDWHQDIRTHEIEELDLNFSNPVADSVSYQECFPELKKLTLELEYPNIDKDPREALSPILPKILPHVLGLKSLCLKILAAYKNDDAEDSYTLLSDITKLSELEELSVDLDFYMRIKSPELFLNQLPTCCPKLRVLKIWKCMVVEEATLLALLTLPQLESFEMSLWDEFPNIELSELKHLTELNITIFGTNSSFVGLFKVLDKIPRLKKLVIEFKDSSDMDDSVPLNLICGAAIAASSVGKDVLVNEDLRSQYITKLMITKSSHYKEAEVNHRHDEILEISFNHLISEPIVEGVRAFVRNKLTSYDTVLFKSKYESCIIWMREVFQIKQNRKKAE